MRNWLGQRSPVIAKSDGSGFLIHGRWISGSRRFGENPVISFEVSNLRCRTKILDHCSNVLSGQATPRRADARGELEGGLLQEHIRTGSRRASRPGDGEQSPGVDHYVGRS